MSDLKDFAAGGKALKSAAAGGEMSAPAKNGMGNPKDQLDRNAKAAADKARSMRLTAPKAGVKKVLPNKAGQRKAGRGK